MQSGNFRRLGKAAFFILAAAAIASQACADAWKPRCAVIVNSGSAEAEPPAQIAALIDAELSEQKVQLVDRESIDRLAKEQYLSKSGLADAGQAIATGKFLSADLIALISTADDCSTIIVFDAGTGVRLADSATTEGGDRLAGIFSRDILRAIDKGGRLRSVGVVGGVKTVCLQTFRNVDLPPQKDAIVRATGAILMRRLAASPDVAVLERESLGRVTNERELTGVEQALLASTIAMQLQISRGANGDGVDVSGVLESESNERTPISASHVANDDPNAIAEAILPSLLQDLRVAKPEPASAQDRASESKRFMREAMLLWSHEDDGKALDAAEAAYALDPTDFHAAAVRARAILVAGLDLMCTGEFADPSKRADGVDIRYGALAPGQSPVPESTTLLALQFIERAEDAIEAFEFGAMPARQNTTTPRLGPLLPLEADPIALNAQELLRQFLCKLRWERFERGRVGMGQGIQLTAQEEELVGEIQKRFRHRRFDLERAYARAKVKDAQTLWQYEQFVNDLLRDARCTWPADGKEWTEDWSVLLADWVVLEKELGNVGANPFPPRFVRRMQTTRPLLSTSRPSTQPWRMSTTRPDLGALQARRRLASTFPFRPRYPMMGGRIPVAVTDIDGSYPGASQWGGRQFDINWKMTAGDWQRLIDATKGLTAVGGYDANQAVSRISFEAARYVHPDTVQPVSNRPADAPPPPARHFRRPTIVRADAVEEPTVGPGTAWADSRVLLDYGQPPADSADDGGYVVLPKVDYANGTVYALSLPKGGRFGDQQIDLISVHLADGSKHVVSTLKGLAGESLPDLRITSMNRGSAALAEEYYVYCDPLSGVYLFPLPGGEPIVINAATAKLPTEYYQSAALMDGILYLAIGAAGREGYLVAYDLHKGTYRTLASSRRLEGPNSQIARDASTLPSPFDNQLPLFAWYMQADAAAHRIVLLVQNAGWPQELNGWWEYRPATGQFKSLLPVSITSPNFVESAVWVTPSKDRRIAFGGPTTQPSVLDLAHDSASLLPAVPAATDYHATTGVTGDAALQYPFAEDDGWVWGRFGRYRASKNVGGEKSVELQSFDPVRKVASQWGDWPTFLEPVDGDHVIVGDLNGMWYLHVPADDPAAMRLVVQPPRPTYVPVEPVGRPPEGTNLPWSWVQTIYDVLRNENVGDDPPICLVEPQVVGNSAYVLAGGDRKSNDLLRFLKYSLDSGVRSELASLTSGSFGFHSAGNHAEQAVTHYSQLSSCIDANFYYVASPNSAIYAFPLAGGAPKVMNFNRSIVAIAALGGKLFVTLSVAVPRVEGDSPLYSRVKRELVRIEVASGVSETLPLPEAASEPAPPTVVPPVDIRLLEADPRRHRVLFFLNCQPRAKPELDGLWSCTPDGLPQRIDPFDHWSSTGERMGESIFDHCSAIEGDSWLLVSENGAFRLNVATMGLERLWQVEPAGEAALGSRYEFVWPVAAVGDFLWDGYIRRAKLDGSVYEQLPWIRPMDMQGYAAQLPTMISIHDGRDLLMADNCGMWIAKMKKP